MELLVRILLVTCVGCIWWWATGAPLSEVANLALIVGGAVLVVPVAWLGRKALDRHTSTGRTVWITTFVHCAVLIFLGAATVRAISTHHQWSGWILPVPADISLVFVIVTGAACVLTVANLALKGLGAPFFIALSRKLTSDWLYAWTRNPMVLATSAWLLSLGLWFQSGLFVLWVLILFVPALLFFVKVFEERELEIRFGRSYLEYKSRTPMLFPGRRGR